MGFKINFFNKKNNIQQTYLGIQLKEDRGSVFLLKINENKTDILVKETFVFSNAWDNLAEDIDEVLYRFELKGYKTPDEVIFFVYGFAIEKFKREIKKEYLLKIKNLVKNLELKPLGYIESQESVINLVETRDKIPTSAVLIEIGKTLLNLYFYKNGSMIYSDQTSRTENLINDTLQLFEKIKKENSIPPRVILYDGKEIDIKISEIISQGWGNEIFIHPPKVEVCKEDEILQSMIDIFSQKMLSKYAPKKAIKEKKEIMGFLINDDIGKKEQKTVTDKEINTGFIDEPFTNKYLDGLKANTTSFINFFRRIFSNIAGIKYFKSVLSVIGLLLVIGGVFLIELYFHKADVTIFVKSQILNKELLIDKLNIQSSVKTIPISLSKKTTGKKETGEKAKGEVTIHNFDNVEKKFDKGTILKVGDLIYLTDDDIKVASSSLTIDSSAKLPGKNKIKITAQNIGSNFNLDSNRKFSIADLSETDYFAINENPITGGNRKEVVIVSQNDIDNLKEQALKEGEKKSKDNSILKLEEGYLPINLLTETSLASTTYNKELGEEANNLSLKGNIQISYEYYKNSDLINETYKDLLGSVKSNFSLSKNNITYKITKGIEKNGKVILTVKSEAKALEKVNINAIQKKIR